MRFSQNLTEIMIFVFEVSQVYSTSTVSSNVTDSNQTGKFIFKIKTTVNKKKFNLYTEWLNLINYTWIIKRTKNVKNEVIICYIKSFFLIFLTKSGYII